MNKLMRLGTVGVATGLLCSAILLPVNPGQAAADVRQGNFNAAVVKSKSKSAAGDAINLKVNGENTGLKGLLLNGKTLVPVAFLRDALKIPTNYDSKTKTWKIGQGYRQLTMMVAGGSVEPAINGFYIDGEVKLINGKIYIPFQWVKDYLGYDAVWNNGAKQLNVIKSRENKITVTTSSYDKESKRVSVHLQYPQLDGMGDAKAEKAINTFFEKQMEDHKGHIDEVMKDLGDQNITNPNSFESSYLVTYNQNGVLSLLFQYTEYTGGAHGMSYRTGYTFSLKDGKLLELKDLLGANKDYEKRMNARLSKELKADPGYMGGFKGLKDNPDFYLLPGRVQIFFQLYEYTPYAAGFPEFSFTWNELLPKGSSPFASFK